MLNYIPMLLEAGEAEGGGAEKILKKIEKSI